MVLNLINKDVFEPSYNDLKFRVWNCNYFCTNLANSLEKSMAPHSSTLAWKIPWLVVASVVAEHGLWSTQALVVWHVGSVVSVTYIVLLRVGHDWATSPSLFTFMHWRRKWQPTPVSLPWESQGRGSLVGWRLWGRTESDTTEATLQQQQQREPSSSEVIRVDFNPLWLVSWTQRHM